MNSIILKSDNTNEALSAWNRPSNNIDKPADAISATTAGLRADKTV